MLGKLIKNEFINRGKQAASIFIALLCLSCVVAVMSTINENVYIESEFFKFSFILLAALFLVSEYAVVIALLLGSVQDFGKRFFKDQGYLTHTLPVKTSALMLARMVYDLVLIVAIAIVIPFSICIAARNFSFYSRIADWIEDMVGNYSGGALEASIVIIDIILFFVMLLILALSSIWMFNVSYAIGHAFNNAKKLMSSVVFCAFGTLNWAITYIVGTIILDTDVFYVPKHTEVTVMMDLIVVIAVAAVSVAIYAVITGYVCKKKLNLE